MTEYEVSLGRVEADLHGTANVPGSGRLPTVLMLHGSGPLDRDANMPGQRLDVFNTLASRLSRAGIASVRYDKRGCGKSAGSFVRTGFRELVADAVAWVDWLRAQEFVDPERTLLVGHSEGCLVASLVAIERPAIAGAALLCPFVESMESVLMRQAAQIERELAEVRGVAGWIQRGVGRLFGSPTMSQRRLIDLVRASTSDTLRFRGTEVSAKWLRELIAIDAREVARSLACPLLLVGGEKDLQCDPADVAAIASLAAGPVTSHVIAGLTHLLRRDDRPPTLLGARALLDKPVDPEVLEIVTTWCREVA